MSGPSQKIVIASGADDNYAMPLGITLFSALDHLESDLDVKLHILDGGIEPENRSRIEAVVRQADPAANFHWSGVDTSVFADFPTSQYLTPAAYLRLLIPDLVSDDVDKAIYLDGDLLVEANLGNLWRTDLDGHSVGAVRSIGSPFVSMVRELRECDALDLPPRHPYFNAGVLLINVAKWREENITEQILDFISRHPECIGFADQDGLNAVLAHDWKALDLKWNVTPFIYNLDRLPDSPFKEKLRARRDAILGKPHVFHFVGPKPWDAESPYPEQIRWVRHLWRSGWFPPGERLEWLGRWMARFSWEQTKQRTRPWRHDVADRVSLLRGLITHEKHPSDSENG